MAFAARGRQTREGGKKSYFRVNISKTVGDASKVTNRKSYMGFRFTPRSMTLGDLELL